MSTATIRGTIPAPGRPPAGGVPRPGTPDPAGRAAAHDRHHAAATTATATRPAAAKPATPADAHFGDLLRAWRQTRHVSQLELSSVSGVSTRHLSFMETGRAKPSRDMVLRLADELEIPLKDQNTLLVAAGYAPLYQARPLDAPEMAAARRAIDVVLTGHLPFPALMQDSRSNIIQANASIGIFTDLVAPHLLEGGGNTARLTMHPEGLAPHMVNFGEARDRMLRALSRRVAASGDPELAALLAEVTTYPHPEPVPEPDLFGGVVVPFRFRRDGRVLSFFSTVASFGTPVDLTLADLALETFFPADEETSAALQEYVAKNAG
jgi:transcriptional regulator with XRE-family HTH domain